jgi:O-antigen/teichoic acid export membrane protein
MLQVRLIQTVRFYLALIAIGICGQRAPWNPRTQTILRCIILAIKLVSILSHRFGTALTKRFDASALKATLSESRRDILGYASSTLSLAIGVIAQTLAFVVLARSLGAEQYGRLTIIMTASSIGLMWCGLGSGEVMRRRVARDKSAYPEVLGHAMIVLAASSVAIGLATSAILSFLVKIDPAPVVNFLVIAALVASNQGLAAWISLSEAIFLSHDDIKGANYVNVISSFARVTVVIGVCLGLGVNTLVAWAFWNLVSSLLIATVCALAVTRFGWPRFLILRDELARGTAMSFGSLIANLRMNMDVLALGVVASPAVVGIYGVCRRVIATASIVGHSFDRLVYARLAIAGRNGPGATLKLAQKYAVYVVILSVAASLALYLCAPVLLLLFGQQYAAAVPILEIMCWSLPLTSLQFLGMDALNAADRHKTRLVVEALVSAVCIALIIVLTLKYTLPGMLAAVYVTTALIVIALWATLWWLTRETSNSGSETVEFTKRL